MANTHLITGYAGREHIMSADQGSFNASFFGTGEYVMEAGNQLDASITNNNTVRILDGDILMQGRHIRINPSTYEDMNITTGTAGKNRNDLIVCEYSKDANTGIETAEIKVIKGTEGTTASDPSYTHGNILAGAALNQMPLYRVKVQGVVLTSIESLFNTIPTFASLAEQYEQEFIEACETHLNSLNVIDSLEEIEANTQSNQIAGALAAKELSNRMTSLIVGTIASGVTSITLTNSKIKADSIIDIYFENKLLAPTSVTVTNGSITIEIDEQETETKVGVRAL